MANRYKELFLEWCYALLRAQITDDTDEMYGSFRCESCGFSHGRADNAVYPFVYAYILTEDVRYKGAAERLLTFRKKLTQPSGSVQNDFTSAWEGITAFSAIGLLKTLLYFGDKIPASLKNKIEECAVRAADWVYDRMTVGFPAYINYYCAASLCNALYARYTKDDKYARRAKELMAYCLDLFTDNGFLAGEGKPHNDRSPKGCLPIDIGYVAEESMPCLIHAAELLGDESAIEKLTHHALKLLDFFLPDGGWDNSFGVRNNKWTYYGSRTSDGCIGAFAILAKRNDLFAEAAERTYRILKRCTKDGLLYGGVQYVQNGQKPCVHHTFCHVCALADALYEGLPAGDECALPCDGNKVAYTYYPELDTYKIRVGKYLVTLTGYDYATHHFANGAAHASGGTLSLLYKDGVGPMIAGSVYRYVRTEPNNMQEPTGGKRHSSLLVRAETEINGVKYATCLDRTAVIQVRKDGETVCADVRAKCVSETGESCTQDICFSYRFSVDGVTVNVKKSSEKVRFVLPIIEHTGEVLTAAPHTVEPIFFLTGGFSADEYTFSLEEDVAITIR